MKRVFIVKNTPLGESEPLSVDLTGTLLNMGRRKDLELNLIISKSNKIPEKIKENFSSIHEIKASTYSIKDNLKFSLNALKKLTKENRKSRIGVIHAVYPNSSLLAAVMFKLLHPVSAPKIIYEVRSPWIEMSVLRGHIKKRSSFFYKPLMLAEEKILCKFVDKFIFITKGLQDYYEDTFKVRNKPTMLIPSGVDLGFFKPSKSEVRETYGIKKGDKLLGYVGGIDERRRLDEFLELFGKAASKDKSLKLMFVGDGNSRQQLESLSKSLKVDNRVIFTGKIDHSRIPSFISSFDYGICHLPDIFVFRNSSPIKIFEYSACGVPVLASDIKAHQEISKKISSVMIYDKSSDLTHLTANKKEVVPSEIGLFSCKNLANKYLEYYV